MATPDDDTSKIRQFNDRGIKTTKNRFSSRRMRPVGVTYNIICNAIEEGIVDVDHSRSKNNKPASLLKHLTEILSKGTRASIWHLRDRGIAVPWPQGFRQQAGLTKVLPTTYIGIVKHNYDCFVSVTHKWPGMHFHTQAMGFYQVMTDSRIGVLCGKTSEVEQTTKTIKRARIDRVLIYSADQV